MDHEIWAKMHGGAVHFPIALILSSGAMDASGFCFPGLAVRFRLHAAGYWTMLLGAVGTVPAVLSGLLMTRGVMLGHDALRLHHLFAWPAFALIIGAATWRVCGNDAPERRITAGYLGAVGVAAVLVLAAGYWGGEMLLGHS
jgi:uncharacterized membrane protein